MSRIEPESYEVGSPDLEVLRFRFRTIQLAHLPWREFLARPNPVTAALMAKMRFAAEERPKALMEIVTSWMEEGIRKGVAVRRPVWWSASSRGGWVLPTPPFSSG